MTLQQWVDSVGTVACVCLLGFVATGGAAWASAAGFLLLICILIDGGRAR
jgi:hypothetical protein